MQKRFRTCTRVRQKPAQMSRTNREMHRTIRQAAARLEHHLLNDIAICIVVAWILAENEIIGRDAVMNAKTLPAVKMPAAGRFVADDRTGKVVR